MQALFWIAATLLFYTYIGYGLLLRLLNLIFKRKSKADESFLPAVTFIVPAYNEEAVIEQKIQNTLSLNYPSGKIYFLIVSDGSTDNTPQIIKKHPQIILLHRPERRGKSAAINRAMQAVQTPIVVFSDANAMVHPQSLRRLVRHYADERVGGVSGEKRIAPKAASTAAFGERLYWYYESLLKKANGNFYTLVGAAGELFSIRTKLFQPLNEDVILDDFVLSASVCLQGRRFLYEPQAYAVESASATLEEERKRKMRISAGCYQALTAMPALLNPFKHLRLTFQYVSHRVLRWAVCPLALPLLFVSNAVWFIHTRDGLAAFFFWSQCVFYFFALMGWALSSKQWLPRFLLVPSYFLFMIAAQYAGFYRFCTGRQTVLWEKAHRPAPASASSL